MIADKIDLLLRQLCTTNTDIAYYCGCTQSNISRLRSGARVPKKDSQALAHFVNGVYKYAKSRGKMQILKDICGIRLDMSPQECREKMTEWICSEYPAGILHKPGSTFGSRLSELMDMCRISNIRLSRQLNVDPSYISRFRSGERLPLSNPQLIENMCGILFNGIVESGKLPRLEEMLGIEPMTYNDIPVLCGWICDFDKGKYQAVAQLIEDIETYSHERTLAVFSESKHLADVPVVELSEYIGIEGLKCAATRFLKTAVLEGTKELWLYSDMALDWMDGDFRARWLLLISECLKRKIHIKVIHTIDRTVSDILFVIRDWLPLYMTGLIEPYYCKRYNGDRFSHTMFINPNKTAVACVCVHGLENSAVFRYDTDNTVVERYMEGYTQLISESKPLVKIRRAASDETETGTVSIKERSRSYIVVRHKEPKLQFEFNHPLICGAFREYLRNSSHEIAGE